MGTEETEQQAEQAEDPQKPKKRKKLVDVQVVEERDGSALVQWLDGDELRRCYVPADVIEDGKADKDKLKGGVPHGLPWASFLETPPDLGAAVERELHRVNIWTAEDFNTRGSDADRAIRNAVGPIFKTLRKAAKEA